VEEHFYLVFTLLLIRLRRKLASLQVVLISVLVLALAWRFVMVYHFDASDSRVTAGTDTRIDSIGFGCMLSVIVERAKFEARWRQFMKVLRQPAWSAVALALLILTMLNRSDEFRQTLRYTLQGLAFMPIFAALFYSSSTLPILDRALSSALPRWAGLFSYSLYLWHALAWQVALMLHLSRLNLALFGFFAAFCAAALSYFLVEQPFLALGARLSKRVARHARLNASRTT